jgi:hypothetical protein
MKIFRRSAGVCLVEVGDDDLLHLHHGLHGAIGLFWDRDRSGNGRGAVGTTCQDRPNLSLSHPHFDSSPPSAISLFQK